MPSPRRLKLLVVYKELGFPIRTTVDEHLYSFLRYADAECYYIKLDIGKERSNSTTEIPAYLLKIDFDIIVFHYGFMATRWLGMEYLQRAAKQVEALRSSKAVKVILPQDEYKNGDALVWFINYFKIDIVFSVSPDSEWPMLYKGVDFEKVKFYKVLTGYLDEGGLKKINRFLKEIPKDIDIAYRARKIPAWLGRHGYAKGEIAGIFAERLKKYRLSSDISVRAEDTILGDGWYKFLVRAKYFIGVEGGATVLDWDGSIWKNGTEYMSLHPNAGFEEVEKVIFPDMDGKLQLIAISPRHLETCATRTCQVLLESSYNGILKPGIHYIEIKKDFSNLDAVLKQIQDDTERERLVNNAYKDIVESGKYSYQSFVKFVISKSTECADPLYAERPELSTRLTHLYNRLMDWFSWKMDYFWLNIYDRLPSKWTIFGPFYKLFVWLGLKDGMKRLFMRVTGKKKFF
jgi:hypothetical protein